MNEWHTRRTRELHFLPSISVPIQKAWIERSTHQFSTYSKLLHVVIGAELYEGFYSSYMLNGTGMNAEKAIGPSASLSVFGQLFTFLFPKVQTDKITTFKKKRYVYLNDLTTQKIFFFFVGIYRSPIDGSPKNNF